MTLPITSAEALKRVAEFLVEVAYDTVDSTGLFGLPSHIVDKTAGIEVAFVTANVVVHGALAGRLVSVEVTFNKESRDTVFQHAEITHIFCSVVLRMDMLPNSLAYGDEQRT